MGLRIYGNRQIKTLPGDVTRPTLAKVREAVFNIWQGTIEDCCWLDICSGSGAMGAEALCRGAAVVTGIEQLAPACAVIQTNWQQVARPEQQYRVLRGDVRKLLKTLQGQQFDRIYFDPPYAGDLYRPVIEAVEQYELLAAAGEMAVEHSPHGWELQPDKLEICREKRYGSSALTFYRWGEQFSDAMTASSAEWSG